MAEYPYLPLFVTDYRSDTDHLSDAEHGIYLQLLMLIWQSPECRIPNDDEWIARRFRRDADAVRLQVRPIISEFCLVHNGWVTQKRLSHEWKWKREKSKKNTAAANQRWNKEKEQCERSATVHAVRNAPTLPYPTPSKDKEDSIALTGNKSVRTSDDWPKDYFDKFWDLYPPGRKTEKKAVAAKLAKIRRYREVTFRTLMDGVARYVAIKPDPQYTKSPLVWLNKGCWDDEIIKGEYKNGTKKSERTVQDAATDLLARIRGFDEPAPGGVRGRAGEDASRLLSKG
jgi:uncharacterized protein YdaU (DUF1376 family)